MQGIEFMDAISRINLMMDHCQKFNHVEKLQMAYHFLSDLKKMYESNLSQSFNNMVNAQLDLFCSDFVEPIDFYLTANSPRHKIRNKMIVFCIDHPEYKKFIKG